MNTDLQHIIALQKLDSLTADAQRRLGEEPERQRALDARIETAKERLAHEKAQIAANQNARREVEKEVAVHQGRLSKFREQAMAVKTNQEYHAIQHEIAFAQTEIKNLEDKILDRMLEADELNAAIKRAESDLGAEQKAVEADRKAMAAETAALRVSVERSVSERAALVASITPGVLAIFELVSRRRNGVAVAEARDGICTICHVRLRPQVFNHVRRNEDILQCDSCQRILYFVPAAAPATPDGAQAR